MGDWGQGWQSIAGGAFLLELPVRPLQFLALALLGYVLFAVGRGLAILDDYQNLPMTSILATGDIPPRFALDPRLSFNYHYATLLFSAQVMRVGDIFVWTALDLVRGFGAALAFMLGGLFVRRFTRSSFLGFVAVLFALFGGGLRWGMLLLPENVGSTWSANYFYRFKRGAWTGFYYRLAQPIPN